MPTRSNALDVASYILGRRQDLTTIELQKLVYYAQAWNLAWDGRPLFDDPIQAWQNGPVVPRLFQVTKKRWRATKVTGGRPEQLTTADRATIDAVLEYYGQFNAAQLVEMTHQDAPWAEAWGDRPADASGDELVRLQTMRRFYTVQQLMGAEGPKRPATEVSEAPLDAAMEEADRQMKKWRTTLDWLAVR